MSRVLSLFALFFLSTSLFADYCVDDPCSCSTEIAVDFLWWDVMGDQIYYGIVIEGIRDTTPDPTVENLSERLLQFNPDWSPGVRVHLIHNLQCQDLALFASWTWYETENTQNTRLILSSDPDAFLSFNSVFIGGVGAQGILEFETGDIDAHYYFKLNRVDIGFLKSCCLCCDLQFSPFAAFTYIHTDENLTLVTDFDNQTSSFFKRNNYRNHTSFDGYGIKLGLAADWSFCQCFSFYSAASLTGAWGCYENDTRNIENEGGTIADIDIDVTFKHDDWRGRLYSQLQLGVKYTACLCRCPVFAMVGWEHQMFFNQTNWSVFSGEFATPSTLPVGDLTLQGLVVRAGFSF
ncbi:MAG: hypothetical protein K940chlam3_01287 [Chlamydiae bacterium]|nr:hypothetical protein [Chlamydiota bacterium]